jgi:tetratricopeptide (TPR) repeat protein
VTRAIVAIAMVVLGGTAHAQAPETGEAQDEFVAGLRAAEALEWDRALASFERSYALAPTAAALFNAATALRALGRHVDARDALARLLREHPVEPDVRVAAEQMLEEENARIATLVLRGLPADRVSVRLDGARRDDAGERPLALDADAGDRGLAIEHAGHDPFFWNGALAEGERREVSVALVPARGAEAEWYERPWVWLAAGGVVIAGAIVLVLLATSGGQLEPRTDPVLRP